MSSKGGEGSSVSQGHTVLRWSPSLKSCLKFTWPQIITTWHCLQWPWNLLLQCTRKMYYFKFKWKCLILVQSHRHWKHLDVILEISNLDWTPGVGVWMWIWTADNWCGCLAVNMDRLQTTGLGVWLWTCTDCEQPVRVSVCEHYRLRPTGLGVWLWTFTDWTTGLGVWLWTYSVYTWSGCLIS